MILGKHWRIKLFLPLCILCIATELKPLTSYSRNDPYPVFTTLDPHDFLYTRKKQQLKGEKTEISGTERFGFSLSPFGQNADQGKNLTKEKSELGDLTGRWGLVALMYGSLPQGTTSFTPTLEAARAAIFPAYPPGTINDPSYIDPKQQFGFISFPIKYRKRGLRFECSLQIINDIGITLQSGLSDICQTVTATPLCSSSSECDCLTTNDNVTQYLTCKYVDIAKELDIDIYTFHRFSIEDIQLILYWRHAYEINKSRENWPQFLAIPFVTLGGSIGAGEERCPQKIFSLSFGNNGHNAIGITGGIDLDFVETIEIGAEAGITHFFDRDICNARVPTSEFQSNIFPYTTDITVSPGLNWHFGAKMLAYHFLERLSGYFQYVIIQHRKDSICLKKSDSAFLPEVLEDRSCWQVQLANIGFNYDISPNVSLGFLWQAPLAQQNAYRSTTIMFSLSASF